MRATFVFQNPRAELLRGVAAGSEPDSTLLGANHLAGHGIDARVYDALLTRRPLPAPVDRLAWNLRELTLPFELGRTDVLFTPMANLAPLGARARRLPTVVVNYGLNLIRRRATPRRRALLDRSLRASARVICLGESQQAELLADGFPPELLDVMLVPIDERFFTPREEAATEHVVLTVGKDLSRDYRTFLAACGDLDARLELVVHPRNLESLVSPRNARVQRVSSIDLRSLYAEAACVVVPQRADTYAYGSEGGGLTALLEAMAMGRAVVATERAILRDYVDDGVEALLVPPEDPAAMRAAIERVLGDPELARSLGAAGRARVERAHTTRGFAAQLAPLLRDVVYGGRT